MVKVHVAFKVFFFHFFNNIMDPFTNFDNLMYDMEGVLAPPQGEEVYYSSKSASSSSSSESSDFEPPAKSALPKVPKYKALGLPNILRCIIAGLDCSENSPTLVHYEQLTDAVIKFFGSKLIYSDEQKQRTQVKTNMRRIIMALDDTQGSTKLVDILSKAHNDFQFYLTPYGFDCAKQCLEEDSHSTNITDSLEVSPFQTESQLWNSVGKMIQNSPRQNAKESFIRGLRMLAESNASRVVSYLYADKVPDDKVTDDEDSDDKVTYEVVYALDTTPFVKAISSSGCQVPSQVREGCTAYTTEDGHLVICSPPRLHEKLVKRQQSHVGGGDNGLFSMKFLPKYFRFSIEGQIVDKLTRKQMEYAWSLDENDEQYLLPFDSDDRPCGMIVHANDAGPENANLRVFIDEFGKLYACTTRDIQNGEELFVCYGAEYWGFDKYPPFENFETYTLKRKSSTSSPPPPVESPEPRAEKRPRVAAENPVEPTLSSDPPYFVFKQLSRFLDTIVNSLDAVPAFVEQLRFVNIPMISPNSLISMNVADQIARLFLVACLPHIQGGNMYTFEYQLESVKTQDTITMLEKMRGDAIFSNDEVQDLARQFSDKINALKAKHRTCVEAENTAIDLREFILSHPQQALGKLFAPENLNGFVEIAKGIMNKEIPCTPEQLAIYKSKKQ